MAEFYSAEAGLSRRYRGLILHRRSQQCDQLKTQHEAAKMEQRQKWQEYNQQRQATHMQVTAPQNLDHSQLLTQNQSLSQHLGQNLHPK